MLETLKQAKIGSIVPIYKEIDEEINAFEYFAKLSKYGKAKNSLFIEYENETIGSANPCLVIKGKNDEFEIKALNDTGKRFLQFIKKDFSFCQKAVYGRNRIYGILAYARRAVSEEQRLKLKTHMDIIRTVAFKFKPEAKLFMHFCGLFGVISYDFIGNIEDLPQNSQDTIKDPDYELFFLDNIFLVNHKTKKTFFVANALVTDSKKEKIYARCNKIINNYDKLVSKKPPKGKKFKKKEFKISYDASRDDFLRMLRRLKRNVMDGHIIFAKPSRLAICNYNAEPLNIYSQLKKFSFNAPAFYIKDEEGVIMGSGSGENLRVTGEGEKTASLGFVMASKPRGIAKGEVDNDLDNKYEAMLRTNENEIMEHITLVDAARNEIAKISRTRYVDKLFAVRKQDNAQNLITNVKGTLTRGLDALHAYMATINFSAGLPKVRSIELLRQIEKTSRGFCNGSIIRITPNYNLDSASIEALRLKKDKVYIRTSSSVYYRSNDKEETEENDRKLNEILDAIKSAGGLK